MSRGGDERVDYRELLGTAGFFLAMVFLGPLEALAAAWLNSKNSNDDERDPPRV